MVGQLGAMFGGLQQSTISVIVSKQHALVGAAAQSWRR